MWKSLLSTVNGDCNIDFCVNSFDLHEIHQKKKKSFNVPIFNSHRHLFLDWNIREIAYLNANLFNNIFFFWCVRVLECDTKYFFYCAYCYQSLPVSVWVNLQRVNTQFFCSFVVHLVVYRDFLSLYQYRQTAREKKKKHSVYMQQIHCQKNYWEMKND